MLVCTECARDHNIALDTALDSLKHEPDLNTMGHWRHQTRIVAPVSSVYVHFSCVKWRYSLKAHLYCGHCCVIYQPIADSNAPSSDMTMSAMQNKPVCIRYICLKCTICFCMCASNVVLWGALQTVRRPSQSFLYSFSISSCIHASNMILWGAPLRLLGAPCRNLGIQCGRIP